MTRLILDRRESRRQAKPLEPAGRDGATVLAPLPPEETTRHTYSPAPHSAHGRMLTAEAAATVVQPQEVLIADPRGGLTPAQMVEQKLLALGTRNPGLIVPARNRPQELR